MKNEGVNIATQYLLGPGGLEPPTLRLSGVRSNHLSYEPTTAYAVNNKIQITSYKIRNFNFIRI